MRRWQCQAQSGRDAHRWLGVFQSWCNLVFSQPLPRRGCNNAAEAWALCHAMQCLSALQLYTDSRVLADYVVGDAPAPVASVAGLAGLLAECRATFAAQPDWQLRWVPRHRNALADALARNCHTDWAPAWPRARQ